MMENLKSYVYVLVSYILKFVFSPDFTLLQMFVFCRRLGRRQDTMLEQSNFT